MRRAGSTHGRDDEGIQNLVHNSDANSPHGKPRPRWEDNTKEDVEVIMLKDVDWIHIFHIYNC
jgi:hypothetical protein